MERPRRIHRERVFKVTVLEGAMPILDRLARFHGGRLLALDYAIREALIREHDLKIKQERGK